MLTGVVGHWVFRSEGCHHWRDTLGKISGGEEFQNNPGILASLNLKKVNQSPCTDALWLMDNLRLYGHN